jgi:hypothetical protein
MCSSELSLRNWESPNPRSLKELNQMNIHKNARLTLARRRAGCESVQAHGEGGCDVAGHGFPLSIVEIPTVAGFAQCPASPVPVSRPFQRALIECLQRTLARIGSRNKTNATNAEKRGVKSA